MKTKLKWLRNETGQVLILVLVLMGVGALILGPLLSYMSTGIKAGTVYENKAADFYAADSGVEDGLWQIKNDHLQTLIPSYDVYGFDKPTTDYPSGLTYAYPAPLNVNNQEVSVIVSNAWMSKDYTPASMGLSLADLHNIAENARLVSAGSVSGITQYKIALSYNSDVSDPPLYVTQIGVWIPPGFTYNTGSSNLETNPTTGNRPSSVTTSDYNGGTVVTWTWSTPKLFSALATTVQPLSGSSNKINATLGFTAGTPGATPNMVSWIYTGNSVTDIKFAWDANVRVFKIDSRSSGGTEINAYGVKIEQRSLAGTIAGDYQAIGNSLMTDSDHDGYYRETLLTESSTTENSIPDDAEVAAAYLYWSGWKIGNASTPNPTGVAPLNPDAGANLNNWTQTGASAWSSDGSKFVGHSNAGNQTDPARYFTMKNGILDMSPYSAKTVTVSWDQWAGGGTPGAGDKLYFSFWNGTAYVEIGNSGNITTTQTNYSYTIPAAYLRSDFKMQLRLNGFSTAGLNCYVDNITVKVTALNDSCSDFTNWTQTGTAWALTASGANPWPAFQGHSSAGSQTDPTRYLTSTAQALNSYTSPNVSVSWDSWISGTPGSSDRLYISFWNGTTWVDNTGSSGEYQVFSGNIGTTPTSYNVTVPANCYNASFKIRFRVYGYSTAGRNVYIDNVKLNGQVFNDNCSNINTNWTFTVGAWTINNGSGNPSPSFQGQYAGADDSARYLTLASAVNLSAHASQIVNISWDQWASGSVGLNDALQFQFSADGGSSWSSVYTAAQNQGQNGGFYISASSPYPPPNPAVTFGIKIPSQYLTANFKIRLYLAGFGAGKCCYVDNVTLQYWPAALISYDPGSGLSNWTADGDWLNYYNSEFVGQHVSGNRYLAMSSSLNLSAYLGQMVAVGWDQRYTGSLGSTDALQYQFWDGTGWSLAVDALDSSSHPSSFSVNIPSQYITSNFKMRFYLAGFGSGKYCYIDDIKIYLTGQSAGTTAYLKINGHQVSFDNNGNPQKDVVKNLTADRAYLTPNYISGTPSGSSFASFKDVTALIRSFGTKGPNNNYPGNDTYTVGGVNATPAANHSDQQYQLSYAGWSLVIIYTSPATLGHQLYLYDSNFLHNDGNSNLDFDQDGQPGGTITGFLVPNQIQGETNAAQLTCFVGEGDDLYTGDYIALNGTKLWDGITTTGNTQASPNNVWNGKSLGMSADGIDVDTFHIPWASNIIHSGDNSAHIDMVTTTDEWSLIYIIISFRSQTLTGGAITYLIKS
jgi:hypothetical protein